MTNEQIFVMFLKHNRVFSKFKRNMQNRGGYEDMVTVNVTESIINSFAWGSCEDGKWESWQKLHESWFKLCKNFELKGTTNFPTVLKSK